MMNRGEGHFVVVTSLTGIFGTPYRSGYAASKHALHGFYDSMRAELEDSGIKVTIAAPGFVKTGLTEKNTHPMPFLVTAEYGAKKMAQAIAAKKTLYIFFFKYGLWKL